MTDSHPTLTPEQLGQIRDDLLRALSKLERSMKNTEISARPVELDQSCIGRLSRIDALQNQGLTKNLKDREQAQLAQLMDALRRIEEGSYGICSACSEPIGVDRLLIFPETRSCAPCGTRG
jgi:DnaK suppressor protein